MKRVLTAVVLIPVVLWTVLRAPTWLFTLLLIVVTLAALREFYALAADWQLRPYRVGGMIAAALLVITFCAPDDALPVARGIVLPTAFVALSIFALFVLLRALTLPERIRESLPDAAVSFFGLFYPALLLAILGDIRRAERGPWWIVFLLIIVWIGDTAAYYVGRSLGRRHMAPHVSPKKTWEGAAASLIASVLLGGAMGQFAVECTRALSAVALGAGTISDRLPFWHAAALAAVLNVFAQLGDLVESVFKRGAGVKDSGGVLPGHGGVLDRVDALLLAIPLMWYYLLLRG